MALPTPVAPLPTAPSRADGPVIFNQRADPFIAALPPMVVQFNLNITWIGQQVTTIDGYRAAAAQSATDAATSATTAGQKVTLAAAEVTKAVTARQGAEAARDSAQAAAAAAGSAAGLPSMAGNANKFLGVNPSGNGVAWYDAGQKVGDSLETSRPVDASYLAQNGGIYLQSAYPALFAVLGLVGGDVGVNWAQSTSNTGALVKAVKSKTGALIVITAVGGIVMRSTDNGATWASSTPGSGSYAIDIDTDDAGKWIIQLGQAVGGFTQLVSTNDGLSWTGIAPNLIATSNAVFCRFCGSGIWLAGGANAIRRSTDNGVSWSVISGSPSANTGTLFSSDRNGTCVVYVPSGTVSGAFRSTDGFATFSTVTMNIFAPADIANDGKGIWIAVGASGGIMRSTDNALTWPSYPSGTTTSLLKASTDGNGAWLISTVGGVVRKSKDNLSTFESYSAGSGSLAMVLITPEVALAGNNGASNAGLFRSAPYYPFDTATQFKVPQGSPPAGLKSYIKAKVAA